MHVRRILQFGFLCLTLSVYSAAQDVLQVDEQTLNQHIASQTQAVYPPIAKAALIQGTVVFEVRIGTSGKIESMKVFSGPAMLQQAAIDCLKQWTFKPFEKGGVPVAANGRVSIVFSLGKNAPTADEEKLAERYFPLWDECTKDVTAHSDSAKAAEVCIRAAALAEQFPTDRRFIERRSAFVYAATASANTRDLTVALGWAERAVQTVRLGHDDASGNNAAYSTRGTIEGMMGNLAAADKDLTLAEDFERKAVAEMEKDSPGIGHEYRRVLARDLRFHAQVLQALNRPDEAQKKLDEAAKLQ